VSHQPNRTNVGNEQGRDEAFEKTKSRNKYEKHDDQFGHKSFQLNG
jgi:hypothetical protein